MKTTTLALVVVLSVFSKVVCAADYYWVGGSGDWSDLNHWATTSGGSINYFTIPTANDNVFFDANSFSDSGQVVTITSSAVCRNMDWSGADWPTLLAWHWWSGAILRICGSLTLTTNMLYNFQGYVYFESHMSGNTITMSGHTFQNHVVFNNPSGGWLLADDFNVMEYGAIYLESGSLNTNGKKISCSYFRSEYTSSRTLSLDSSVLTVYHFFRIYSDNFTFHCGNSQIRLTGYNAEFSPGDGLTYKRILFTNDTSDDLRLNGNSLFGTVQFMGSGRITGNNTFDTLIFSPGKSYVIGSGKSETINSYLSAIGNCSERIFINSSHAGANSTLTKATGGVTGEYLVLKDVWATGGATFTASNSIDQSNNNGWLITSQPPQNLYWVGDGGNWHDPAHWSFSSGGSGGVCTPSPADHVFFDQNSFSQSGQSVVISFGDAYCNDMNWDGVLHYPGLTGSNSNLALKIFGSMNLADSMEYTFPGKMYFESDSMGNTIATHGKTILNDVVFLGPGGWELTDSLMVNATIHFNNGSFSTNNQNINCNSMYSSYNCPTTPDTLFFMNSKITVRNAFSFEWSNIPILNTGTSIIYMSGVNAYFRDYQGTSYHNVIFTDSTTSKKDFGASAHFQSITFEGSAKLWGWNTYDTLILKASHSYEIVGNHFLNNSVRFTGTCNKYIYLYGGGNIELINTGDTVTGNYLYLEDIHVSGGSGFIAYNSVDMGRNNGWTIIQNTPRDLFWVNNGGVWDDPTHWSSVSNGQGGECMPSAIDNIFFNENSFSIPDQTVYLIKRFTFCKDLSWSNVYHKPALSGIPNAELNLKIFGSLNIDSSMLLNTYATIDFCSNDTNNFIYADVELNYNLFLFSGIYGKWELLSDLEYISIILNNGALHTNGHTIRAYGIWAGYWSNYTLKPTLSLGNSTLFISYNGLNLDDFLNFSCGNSSIYIDGHLNAQNRSFNYVNFVSSWQMPLPYLTGNQNSFVSLLFEGNGVIAGSNTFDTLTLSPGGTYTFNALDTQTINHQLNIRGNNCFPISLKSSQPGSLATLYKPNGQVMGDFLELQNIEAAGGADFYAGNFSTNLGNNPGWIWGNAPGYVYGLPPDTAFCEGDSLVLSIDNFNGGISWFWHDGSTDSTFTVTESGTYFCHVNYASNCYILDSITVTVHPLPESTITANVSGINTPTPGRTSFCEGDVISLTTPAQTVGACYYLWSPGGDTTASITLNNLSVGTHEFTVTVTSEYGCSAFDDEMITIHANPSVSITGDDHINSWESSNLNAIAIPSGIYDYSWSTGDSTPDIVVTPLHTTNYSITITDQNQCSDSASFIVEVPVSVLSRIKVLLQGAMDTSARMTTTLNAAGFLPLSQPYNVPPWNYIGSESMNMLPQAMTDWVLLELRSTPDTIVSRQAGVLMSYGLILDTKGFSGLIFEVPPGEYYIAVHHRNHLPVMSRHKVFLPDTSIYDFTDTLNYPVTGNCVIAMNSRVSAMINGEINHDGMLKYSGSSNDRSLILQQILNLIGGTAITATAQGYFREDLNMNGIIKYSGSGNDQALIIQNIVKLTGSNAITALYFGCVPLGVTK